MSDFLIWLLNELVHLDQLPRSLYSKKKLLCYCIGGLFQILVLYYYYKILYHSQILLKYIISNLINTLQGTWRLKVSTDKP